MSKQPLLISELAAKVASGEPITPEEALVSLKFCSEIGYVVQNGDSIERAVEAVQPPLSHEQLQKAHQYMENAAQHKNFRNRVILKIPYEKAAAHIKGLMDAMNPPEAS